MERMSPDNWAYWLNRANNITINSSGSSTNC